MRELFISKVPNALTNEEQLILLKEYSINYDPKIRERLIEHNILLVFSIVKKKFSTINFEDERDLISVGITGLIKAVDTFDVGSNARFSSYAYVVINNAILDFLKKDKKMLSLDKKQIVDNKNCFDTNLTLLDTIKDHDVDIEEKYEESELISLVNRFINSFCEIDKKIIRLYFGFN